VQRLRGGLRRLARPDRVDQRVGSDDLVGVDQEDGEERALLRRPEVRPPAVNGRFERTEDSKLDFRPAGVFRRRSTVSPVPPAI
jgi:hypothetical protein